MLNFRKYIHLFTFTLLLVAFLVACSSKPENFTEFSEEVNTEEPILSVLDVNGSVTGEVLVDDVNLTCGETTGVTISLTGTNSITDNPVDIMLVLDRSGSMIGPNNDGAPFNNLKAAANEFIDIIDAATDINSDVADGLIEGGSRIGIVSFETNVNVNRSLQTDATDLKTAVTGLTLGDLTNTGDAINAAQAQLAGSNPGSAKVIILVTDGNPTAGPNPNTAADAAKGAGTEIFAIGFGTVDVSNLNAWASNPDSEHVFLTPDSNTLNTIFGDLAAALISPAGTNIEVVATVSDEFSVSNVATNPNPDAGTAGAVGNVITWNIVELEDGTINLTFDATDVAGPPSYITALFDSIDYIDDEGNAVTFDNFDIEVLCPGDITLEPETAMGIAGFDDHTVTATTFYTDDDSVKIEGATVNFEVISGPHAGEAGSDISDASGESTFIYDGILPGIDTIEACFTDDVGEERCDTVTMLWKLPVALDIKPTSCRNPLRVNSGGVLPVAILGTDTFDVNQIDVNTIELVGVSPIRSKVQDVAAPYVPFIGKTDAFDCTTDGPDGFDDLTLKFNKQAIVTELGNVDDGDVLTLTLVAELLDGTVIIGEDVIVILE